MVNDFAIQWSVGNMKTVQWYLPHNLYLFVDNNYVNLSYQTLFCLAVLLWLCFGLWHQWVPSIGIQRNEDSKELYILVVFNDIIIVERGCVVEWSCHPRCYRHVIRNAICHKPTTNNVLTKAYSGMSMYMYCVHLYMPNFLCVMKKQLHRDAVIFMKIGVIKITNWLTKSCFLFVDICMRTCEDVPCVCVENLKRWVLFLLYCRTSYVKMHRRYVAAMVRNTSLTSVCVCRLPARRISESWWPYNLTVLWYVKLPLWYSL